MGVLDGLAATMNAALGPIFYDAVLTRFTPTAGVDAHTPGTPTETTYTCKALRLEYSAGYRNQGLVGAEDFKIMILAGSLATRPQPGDRITIAAQSVIGTIVPASSTGQKAVTTDPGTVTWECRASA